MSVAYRTSVITLNSVGYLLQQTPNEARAFRARTQPLAPGVQAGGDPFVQNLSFGPWGMGGSVYGESPRLYSYGYNTDPSQGDYLSPHYDVGTISLSGSPGTITRLRSVKDQSGNVYLYVVNQTAVLYKVRLDTLAEVTSPKTFSGGSTILTDLIVLKSGNAPGVVSRTVTQPNGAKLLAMFGETRNMEYTNLVEVNAVDTWAGSAATAYGGVGCVIQGNANTAAAVFKSTGVTSQSAGAFSTLQYINIPTSAVDLSDAGLWQPTGSRYQMPHIGESITEIIEWQRGPLVAQPSGVYQFDANYNASPVFPMRSFSHPDNGKHMRGWGRRLIVPTGNDLMDAGSGAIGLTTLAGNLSPVYGYPTAFAFYGDTAFVAYYDGTDTHYVWMRPRRGENVAGEFLHFPFHKEASATCRAMEVVTRADGNTYLFFGAGAALKYIILDPVASRRYEGGGVHYLGRFGDVSRSFVMDRLTAFGKDTGSGKSWLIEGRFDFGSWFTIGTVDSAGALNFAPGTPGTNDHGTFLEVRATCTNGTSTNRPLLVGGGLVLKGRWRNDQIVGYTAVVEAGTMSGGNFSHNRDVAWSNLATLVESGSPVPLIYEDHTGSTSPIYVTVDHIEWIEGQGSDNAANQSFIQIDMTKLHG